MVLGESALAFLLDNPLTTATIYPWVRKRGWLINQLNGSSAAPRDPAGGSTGHNFRPLRLNLRDLLGISKGLRNDDSVTSTRHDWFMTSPVIRHAPMSTNLLL